MYVYLFNRQYLFHLKVFAPGKRDFKTLRTIKDPKNIFTVP